MYTEKQIIMVVQAKPKNQPGGVQGALFKFIYQFVSGPFAISKVPKPSAPKFMIKKKSVYLSNFIKIIVLFF